MPRAQGPRLTISNANIPNMVGQISTELAKANLNIIDMINKSKQDVAYTLIDVDKPLSQDILNHLGKIHGILKLRAL